MPEIGAIALYEGLMDPAIDDICFEWTYWNKDLLDLTFRTIYRCRTLQPHLPVLGKAALGVFGAIGPFMTWKMASGAPLPPPRRVATMIEKYSPHAASYTVAMSAANATPAKIFRSPP